MRAIRVSAFGGPEVLKLQDVPDPAPGAGEVLVTVKAVGVNPVETYVRSGLYPRKPELPYTPGSDAAGVVASVGSGVSELKPGDRVYLHGTRTGAYAEKAVSDPTRCFPLPVALSFEQGAALGVPYATAHRALFHRAGAQRGETVFIHGASGGVGVAAVQLALGAGLTVIGTAGGEAGGAFVRSLGAHHVLDHRKSGYLDALPGLTGGRGPDVILEMLANVNLPADLAAAAVRGRVVVIGSRGSVTLDPRATMSKDLSVLGVSLANMDDGERAATHQALRAGLAAGTLKPVVGRTLPLAAAAAAHEAVMAPGAHGKIVLLP